MNPRYGRVRAVALGFTLVEVLVALIIVAIGLLGLAKMQALAMASTSTASKRSLAALETASLAAAMRANRSYWAAGAAPVPITINGTTISDATLAAAATNSNYCTPSGNAPCNAATLAAYDLHRWVTALNALLPNPTAIITCATSSIPINCTIQVNWDEKAVAVNTQSTNGSTMLAPTYTLYVEP